MESNDKNKSLSIREQSVGYRYEQEVRVLDVRNNKILLGKVTGIESVDELENSTEEYRKRHPKPTITVKFRTKPDAVFQDGLPQTIDFIPETKLPEYEASRDSYRLLD